MNQRYESRKEYSLMDVLQYDLRKWWLAAVFCGSFCSDRQVDTRQKP